MKEEMKPSLMDVLEEFSMTDGPRDEVLKSLAQRYPEHADELAAFALEQRVEGKEPDSVREVPTSSPEILKAMSAFQNALFNARALKQSNPFAKLSRSDFRTLATSLDVNVDFLVKFRDRRVSSETVVPRFRRRLAAGLKTPEAELIAFMRAPPQIAAGVEHKATVRPRVGPQESFEDAARSSGLSEEQIRRLLSE